MGRKKIQKAPKGKKKEEDASHNSEEQPVVQKPKKVQVQSASLFSQAFNEKIESFKSFYTEFLAAKGQNDEEQFDRVIKAVSNDMQKACAQVLQNDLVDAQKWIEGKIVEFQQKIKKSEELEQKNRSDLQNSNIFSGSQIDAQLNILRKKGKQLEGQLEEYKNFQQRIKDIVSHEGRMDEE